MSNLTNELDLLKEFVLIDSQTKNQSGVAQVQEIFGSYLHEIGFTINKISSTKNNNHYLLEAIMASNNTSQEDFITLVTHADTVLGKEDFKKTFSVSDDKSKAYGPGVIDIKGGIVIALLALKKYFTENTSNNLPIKVICSPNEEIGSIGFWDALKNIGKTSKLVIGLEPSSNNSHDVICSRRGGVWYQITVKGEKAHCGRNPRSGSNAGFELSKIVSAIGDLNIEFPDIDINVGTIKSDCNTFNVVCDHAVAKIDFRFNNNQQKSIIDKKVREIVNKTHLNFGNKNFIKQIEIKDDCPCFVKNVASDLYIDKYIQTYKEVTNQNIKAQSIGGSSDCNYMFNPKTAFIDGLGAIGYGLHQHDECLITSSLQLRSNVLAAFLHQLNLV